MATRCGALPYDGMRRQEGGGLGGLVLHVLHKLVQQVGPRAVLIVVGEVSLHGLVAAAGGGEAGGRGGGGSSIWLRV